MRIGIFCSNEFETPPAKESGVIYMPLFIAEWVADGLVDLGHDVTLYSAEGSKSKAKIETLGMEPLYKNKELARSFEKDRERIVGIYENIMLSRMFMDAREGKFDLLHIHPPQRGLFFSPFVDVPVIFTLHDPIGEMNKFLFLKFDRYKNIYYVSISDVQRKPLPDINYAETIYNGISIERFKFVKKSGDYLLCAGRIIPQKGFDVAVRAAKATSQKLILAGSISNSNRDYWKKEIKPFVDGRQIKYVGLLDQQGEMAKVMGGAKAFLFPIDWEEPFGLVMIEAMASGTPVIAFNRGSVPEVVEDGKTGFIVETEEEMIEAVGNIDKIAREDCRKYVEENFSIKNMVDGYDRLFRRLVG